MARALPSGGTGELHEHCSAFRGKDAGDQSVSLANYQHRGTALPRKCKKISPHRVDKLTQGSIVHEFLGSRDTDGCPVANDLYDNGYY